MMMMMMRRGEEEGGGRTSICGLWAVGCGLCVCVYACVCVSVGDSGYNDTKIYKV